MKDLVAPLVDGFTLTTGRLVTGIAAVDGRYRLDFEGDGTSPGYDRVLVAVPAPRALGLLQAFGAPFDRIAGARMAPCWTLLAAFADPIDPGFDIRRDVEALAWVARSASKPGRAGEIWVAQANPIWSAAAENEAAEVVTERLKPMLAAALGGMPEPQATEVKLWRHALVEKAVGETFLLSPDGRVGACGDWLIAPRAESAWASGDGLADAMIAAARDKAA